MCASIFIDSYPAGLAAPSLGAWLILAAHVVAVMLLINILLGINEDEITQYWAGRLHLIPWEGMRSRVWFLYIQLCDVTPHNCMKEDSSTNIVVNWHTGFINNITSPMSYSIEKGKKVLMVYNVIAYNYTIVCFKPLLHFCILMQGIIW